MIALTADRPAKLAQRLESKGYGYALYSDPALLAARKFGIVFQLDDETQAEYQGYGIDLEDASDQGRYQLPVPSVFLVEAGGTIRWVYSNPDYKVRPANEQLMRAARAIAAHQAD